MLVFCKKGLSKNSLLMWPCNLLRLCLLLRCFSISLSTIVQQLQTSNLTSTVALTAFKFHALSIKNLSDSKYMIHLSSFNLVKHSHSFSLDPFLPSLLSGITHYTSMKPFSFRLTQVIYSFMNNLELQNKSNCSAF